MGAVVVDGDRLLLIKRGKEPSKGSWSVPGGRVEPGESDVAAVAREVHEETGLTVRVGPLAGSVERDGLGGVLYVIRDYRCEPLSPTSQVRAGDDAADVGWFTAAEVRRLPCTPGLVETLEEWHVLPG